MCSENRDNKLTWRRKGLSVRSSVPLEDEPQADAHTGHFDYTQSLVYKWPHVKGREYKSSLWEEPGLAETGGWNFFFSFCFSGIRECNPETKLD